MILAEFRRGIAFAAAMVLVSMAILASLAGCGGQGNVAHQPTTGEADQVTLQLNWFPEVEHGGFYAAKLCGFYEDEGLDVKIVPGGPNVPVVQQLDSGRVDFAVTNADRVVFGRDADADIVAVMAAMQHSPRCILVHRESGITSLSNLRDVTLAVGSGPAFYKYMAKHLPLENVQTVAYPGSIGPFLSNRKHAQQAYVFSEPYVAKEKGADPVALMVSDVGFDPYASTLIVRGEMIRERSELVQRFVRATVKGWQHYLAKPASTNRHLDEINPDMEPGVLAYGAGEMAKLCLPDEMPVERFGTMTADRWQTLVDQLAEIDLVDGGVILAEQLFTTQFLTGDSQGAVAIEE